MIFITNIIKSALKCKIYSKEQNEKFVTNVESDNLFNATGKTETTELNLKEIFNSVGVEIDFSKTLLMSKDGEKFESLNDFNKDFKSSFRSLENKTIIVDGVEEEFKVLTLNIIEKHTKEDGLGA